MNRDRLLQYRHIESALKNIRREIKRLRRRAEESTGETIPDVAKGSSPEFPYAATRIKIESIDHTKQDRYLRLLTIREAEYEEILAELEDWLSEIKDPLRYDVLSMKTRNNMTDKQIGDELGYSRSRITQIINDYLQEDKD